MDDDDFPYIEIRPNSHIPMKMRAIESCKECDDFHTRKDCDICKLRERFIKEGVYGCDDFVDCIFCGSVNGIRHCGGPDICKKCEEIIEKYFKWKEEMDAFWKSIR